MENNYTVEQMAEERWFYTFADVNKKGEKLIIELSKVQDDKDYKKSLPKLWAKGGYIDRVLESYWSIETYVKDSEGNSWGMYNPQHKLNEETRLVINFDWMFEATEENKERIINEVYRRFSNATGKSATEEKHEKIKSYAQKNNMVIYNTIPSGWSVLEGAITAPRGTELISNKKSFKSGKRQTALLLTD